MQNAVATIFCEKKYFRCSRIIQEIFCIKVSDFRCNTRRKEMKNIYNAGKRRKYTVTEYKKKYSLQAKGQMESPRNKV